jgi:hypothetical protein
MPDLCYVCHRPTGLHSRSLDSLPGYDRFDIFELRKIGERYLCRLMLKDWIGYSQPSPCPRYISGEIPRYCSSHLRNNLQSNPQFALFTPSHSMRTLLGLPDLRSFLIMHPQRAKSSTQSSFYRYPRFERNLGVC